VTVRILLVLPSSTYRASDFLDAARAVGAEVVVASEEQQLLNERFLLVDLCDPKGSAERIAESGVAVDAVVGVDEQGVLFAAHLANILGLPHNPPRAVATTRDKALTRIVLTDAGLDQPAHRLVHDGEFRRAASSVGYPCVVKAVDLAASRGVIRANDADELDAATARVRAIVGEDAPLLIESYIPGVEVAVEGLLSEGKLDVLAVFDKPDPLEGPFFEETIYVTPSRLDTKTQQRIVSSVQRACTAIGLVEGPIHAEARVGDDTVVVLEVAARSIGGLCSRSLRFGAGISLEEVIVRHALRLDIGDVHREKRASGVMMIPVPSTGTLDAVDGLDDARGIDGVIGVEITVPVGQTIAAWPEGDRYLGFIFAAGDDPASVESSLRDAASKLQVRIA
jgi:formate-dependent phosphoribosylglycinamide formyltransferase (GAR transformylase)